MNYKLWFVVEYCNGGDLNAFVTKNINNHRFNGVITKQLVKGLQFLHQVSSVKDCTFRIIETLHRRDIYQTVMHSYVNAELRRISSQTICVYNIIPERRRSSRFEARQHSGPSRPASALDTTNNQNCRFRPFARSVGSFVTVFVCLWLGFLHGARGLARPATGSRLSGNAIISLTICLNYLVKGQSGRRLVPRPMLPLNCRSYLFHRRQDAREAARRLLPKTTRDNTGWGSTARRQTLQRILIGPARHGVQIARKRVERRRRAL